MPFSKAILVFSLAAGLPVVRAHADAISDTPADPVLQALVDEALAQNPELAATRQLQLAAETRPVQSGTRPGPTIGVFYQNDGAGPSLGREPMTMLGVSGGQDIPYPGKLALRRQVAEAEAAMAATEVERARLGLIGSVKAAYYGLLLARGLATLAQEQREVWEEIQETARVRYASGLRSQQEMLRAQIEATRLQALHDQHHAEARARLAQLNALLGRPAVTPVDTPGALAIAAESRAPAEIVAWTEANSPELKAATLAVERDERAVALARRAFKPDFNVQGGLMYRGGLPPMWQVGASVMLPSRSRVRAALAEAEARLAATRAWREHVRVRLQAVVEQRLSLLTAAQEIEATYRDGLLPQGDVAVQSATATYAAGTGSQVAVLEAAAALLDDRTDHLRLLATHSTERARLEEASLDAPMRLDSLLKHGRSTTPGGGMAPPAGGAASSTMAGGASAATSSGRMDMR